jgi:hypothetical protein
MTANVRRIAIAAAQGEIEEILDSQSSWRDSSARKAALEEFIAVVEVYDGTQEAPESKGLFEAMAEAL